MGEGSDELEEILRGRFRLRLDYARRTRSRAGLSAATDYLDDEKSAAEPADRARVVAYERIDPIRMPDLLHGLPETEDLLNEASAAGRRTADEPALLSATELLAYQSAVSLIQPFDARNLKSSSYEMHIAGDVIYWETPEGGESRRDLRRQFKINRGDRLRLPANSIVFVQTEAEFSLPLYIAVRFNLRITHVHRGLLLGTGPLVDPGFRGRIFIPLHNLTDSDYWIDTSEALIWAEFTRTSYDREWDRRLRAALKKDGVNLARDATAFDEKKRQVTPERYLSRANGQEPIRSAIGPGIERAQKAADQASALVRNITIAGVIGFTVAFASFLAAVFAAIQAVDGAGEVQGLDERLRALEFQDRAVQEEDR